MALPKYFHLCCLLTSCLSVLGTFATLHYTDPPNISLAALLWQHSGLSPDCSFIAGGDSHLSTLDLSLSVQSTMSDCLPGILSWMSRGLSNVTG